MTSKQEREWQELCLRAVKEPDPDKQLEIVAQRNRLLSGSKKANSVPLTRVAKQGR
jgi:hypothetical protein